MRLGDRGQVLERDKGDTFANEHIPLSHKIERFLEWHFDIVRCFGLGFLCLVRNGKSDIKFMFGPLRVAVLDRLII